MTKEDDEEKRFEMKSIGSGEIKRSPSWSDIKSLIGRIETLEQEREDEHVRLVNVSVDDVEEDKAAEPPALRRRASSRPRGTLARMLMRGQSQKDAEFNEELEEVEKKYDDFELPESTYTFLLAEPIFSAPFAFGCVSYALVRSLSVSTLLYYTS